MAVDHYENFPVASVLLPRRFRHPVTLIYRFARAADDIADEGNLPDRERLNRLGAFRAELKRIAEDVAPHTPLFRALAPVIREHDLPLDAFHDLLSAFAQDVTKKRYPNFAEVLDYCRRSANPVGRLLLALYRAATPSNLLLSDRICSSLQLINFLQDVAIDCAKGRIYLPQDELERYGIAETQIARGDTSARWCEFMAFQSERTRRMLREGAPLGRALPGRLGLELRMIVEGGDRILAKIARVAGDVFRQRPVLKPWDWPYIFARAALAY